MPLHLPTNPLKQQFRECLGNKNEQFVQLMMSSTRLHYLQGGAFGKGHTLKINQVTVTPDGFTVQGNDKASFQRTVPVSKKYLFSGITPQCYDKTIGLDSRPFDNFVEWDDTKSAALCMDAITVLIKGSAAHSGGSASHTLDSSDSAPSGSLLFKQPLTGIYSLQALIDFDSLDGATFDPAFGTVSLFGHKKDSDHFTPVSYLDYLATAMECESPTFSLE